MDQFYPNYLKYINDNENNCPRCKNILNKNKILSFSYLSECSKCSNMGMYGINQINNTYNINNIDYIYEQKSRYNDVCKCETIYIYKNITKCNKCILCESCNNELSYIELNNLKNINDTHVCNKCYKKNNYTISENINY